MTTSAPHDEIDAAAYDGLLEALGVDDLRLLVQEFLDDLDRVVVGLDESRSMQDGAKVKSLAHALTGLLAQYACVDAAGFARRIADGDVAKANLRAEDLTQRTIRCGVQWRARLGLP